MSMNRASRAHNNNNYNNSKSIPNKLQLPVQYQEDFSKLPDLLC